MLSGFEPKPLQKLSCKQKRLWDTIPLATESMTLCNKMAKLMSLLICAIFLWPFQTRGTFLSFFFSCNVVTTNKYFLPNDLDSGFRPSKKNGRDQSIIFISGFYFWVLGSISPTLLFKAQMHWHTAFDVKNAIQFHQQNCTLLVHRTRSYTQLYALCQCFPTFCVSQLLLLVK